MKILRPALAATLAASAAIGAGLAAAGPASADAGAIQYVSKILSGTPGHTVLGTVDCPVGTFVVSASATNVEVHQGAALPPGTIGGPITSLAPLRNSRTSPGLANYTAVGVTGFFGTAAPGTLASVKVQAACAPAARLSNATSREITIAPDGHGARRGTVYCPAGMRAFGGGGHFLASDNHNSIGLEMYENSVTADGTGWTFRGLARAGTDRLIVTTQCAPLVGSYVPAPSVPAPPQAPGYVSAGCSIGYTVLSGGVAFAHQDHTEGTGGVSETWTSAGGVGAGGYSYDDSQLIARAQCVPPGSF